MRVLHEVLPEEKLTCEGEYRYQRDGKPLGMAESFMITRLSNGNEVVRADISGQSEIGPTSLLTYMLRSPQGKPLWLRMRFDAPGVKAAAQYTFDDASVRIARQAENQLRRQESLDVANDYAINYHPVVGNEFVWRAYPKHARGKPWSVPVFSPDLWAEGQEIMGGRSLRFSIKPLDPQDISTPAGDYKSVRVFEALLSDGVKVMAWYDDYGLPLRWAYPDKKLDYVLVKVVRTKA